MLRTAAPSGPRKIIRERGPMADESRETRELPCVPVMISPFVRIAYVTDSPLRRGHT